MSKTFTCHELGGICDEKFSGDSFMEIMQKGGAHMMSDEAHKQSIMEMEKRTGESKDMWMERMQKEFDVRTGDGE